MTQRYRAHLAALALVALAFLQQPGRIAGDTKADLVIDPAHFLGQALELWNARQGFGQLGNQSYGYLFPMGPFFLIGHLVGLPAWVVQRLWWVAVLLVAYYGVLRMAALLGIGTPGSRIFGALAYALAPRVLTVLGGISVEAWPGALTPWAVVPLILALRGRLGDRRAAALSGLVVFAMGAVNAAATIAALGVPAVFLLARAARARRRLLAWWIVAVGLASIWWAGPLVILGHYAFPFLDYIENAGITTLTTGVFDTLRGAEHWGGYLLTGGSPRWPAGFQLAYLRFPVLCTCLVAAVGLAGLCRADMPHAGWLRGSATAGLVVITAGHLGPFGGGSAAEVHTLLDGALAAFRNVHKFDPMLRLPLCLGAAHFAATLLAADRSPVRAVWVHARWEWRRRRFRRAATTRRQRLVFPAQAAIALVVALAAFGGSVLPAVQVGVVAPGSYDGVPGYWHRVAHYLAARSSSGSALLLPSSNFAVYAWGSPEDEPLQALARSAWEVRDAVPLGAPGTYRALDGTDAMLAEGRPSPDLAPAYARLGIGFLVLRNDIDALRSGAEDPVVVRAALSGSAGIRRIASFGHGAVEVFSVAGTVPAVSAQPTASALALSGGPEGTENVAAVLAPNTATLLLQDAADASIAAGTSVVGGVVVTDTGRRRALNFGYSDPNPQLSADGVLSDPATDLARYSPTEPASADVTLGRPAAQLGPTLPVDQQTVSDVAGLSSVTASTSAADPFSVRYGGVSERPESAFDGDPATAWVSAGPRAVGSWLAATTPLPIDVPAIDVRFVDNRDIGSSVSEVAVRTDTGEVRDAVARGGRVQRLALPPGPTRSIRITVTAVRAKSRGERVAIAEVAVPGVLTFPELITARTFPPDLLGKPTAVVLRRTAGDRSSCVIGPSTSSCSKALRYPGEEAVPYVRLVRTPGGVGPSMSATVHADSSARAGLATAVARATGVGATASSSAVDALADGPVAVVDGDRATAWTPSGRDRTPRLVLRFASPIHTRTITLRGTFDGVARLDVTAGGRTVHLRPESGRAQHAELSGSVWTVTVHRAGKRADRGGAVRITALQPNGRDFRPAPLAVACGGGPSISVDGRTVPLSIRATVHDVMAGADLRATPCVAGQSLTAGDHVVRFIDAAGWQIAGVALGVDELPHAAARKVTVMSRQNTRITARVAAGSGSFLQLAQSFNPGWNAGYAGKQLTPVRLDGWRQGFLLPASATAGEVVVSFRPDAYQPYVLAAGAAGIAGLALLAVVPSAPSRRRTLRRRDLRRARVATPVRAPRVVDVLVCALLGFVVAGPAGLVIGGLLAALPARWHWVCAAGGMVAAGVAAVVLPAKSVAVGCAVVAACALLAATVVRAGRADGRDQGVGESAG